MTHSRDDGSAGRRSCSSVLQKGTSVELKYRGWIEPRRVWTLAEKSLGRGPSPFVGLGAKTLPAMPRAQRSTADGWSGHKRTRSEFAVIGDELRSQLATVQQAKQNIEDLLFIVRHLGQDISCMLAVGRTRLEKAVVRGLDQVIYLASEHHVQEQLRIAECLKGRDKKLEEADVSVQELKKQQMANEEVFMDELARLFKENEALRLAKAESHAGTSPIDLSVFEALSSLEQIVNDPDFLKRLPECLADRELQFTRQLDNLTLELREREKDCADLLAKLTEQQTETRNKDNMEQTKLDFFKLRIQELEREVESKTAMMARIESDAAGVEEKHREAAEAVTVLEADREKQCKAAEEYESRLRGTVGELSALQEELAVSKEQSKLFCSQLEAQQAETEKFRLESDGLRLKMASFEEAGSASRHQIDRLQSELQASNSLKDELTRQLLDGQRSLEESRRQVTEVQAQVIEKCREQAESSSRIAAELSEAKRAFDAVEKQKNEAMSVLEAFEKERDRLAAEFAGQSVELSLRREELERCNARISELQTEKMQLDELLKAKPETLPASNVEMALRIELEKGRELLMRERKLSSLKIADLEEQLEQMKQEAAGQNRNGTTPGSPLQNENVDPFAEARNRLAAMTSTTAPKMPVSQPAIQPSSRPGAPPPSECLQQ